MKYNSEATLSPELYYTSFFAKFPLKTGRKKHTKKCPFEPFSNSSTIFPNDLARFFIALRGKKKKKCER